jgi:outer membrane biosynthesis protein TonB
MATKKKQDDKQPEEKKPATKRPKERQPGKIKPTGKRPKEKQPSEKKSTGKNPTEKKPAVTKPTEKTPKSTETQPATTKPIKQARVTVFGYSAMAVLRWMGANGWITIDATKAIAALGESGQVKPSTIATGLSDGRSGKWGRPAPVTADQAKQLKQAASG